MIETGVMTLEPAMDVEKPAGGQSRLNAML
jgi:hypothetical protein